MSTGATSAIGAGVVAAVAAAAAAIDSSGDDDSGTPTTSTPPTTVTGTWRVLGRCDTQTYDVWDLFVDLNESTGGAFTGSASGTDYNGTPMQMSYVGTYNSTSKVLAVEVTATFTGDPCVRKDVFSTTLTSNDTGYLSMTQIQVCGCTALIRMIKQ